MRRINSFFAIQILFLMLPFLLNGAIKFSDRPRILIAQIDEKKESVEKTENEKWFSSFMKSYLNFRVGVSSSFDIITQNDLIDPLNPEAKFNRNKILRIADSRKIEHLFLQSFYFTTNNKINFYGEYIPENKISKIYEKEISLENIGVELDSIAIWYLSNADLYKEDKELSRFFKMKVIPDNVKEIIKTGEILSIPWNLDSLNAIEIINELHESVTRDPKNLLASFSAAQLYEKIGNFTGAAKEQNDLLTIIPFYAPLYSNVVRNFRITGNSEKALTFASNAEKKGIINPDLLLEGAITLEEVGIDRQASRAFFSILKLDPFQKRALLYFARAANRERLPKRALQFTDSILSIDSLYGEALLESGRAKMLLSDYTNAEKDLTKSTAYIEKPFEAMMLLGEINTLQQNYEKGALFFENAIKSGVQSVTPYISGSNAWILAQKEDKAFSLLQNAHNLYPNNPQIKKRFGLISFTLKDSSDALKLFEEYTKKFKQDPEILFPMGDIYTAQKNFQKAFFCFNQASQLADDKSYANLKLGMFYLKKGDYIPSEKYLKERLSVKKDDPLALSYLGEVMLNTGNTKEALNHFIKARESGFSGTFCTEQIGLIHFNNGSFQDAFTELSKLENENNNIPDLYYRLAISCLNLKNREKADEYLQFASNNERASSDILLSIANGFSKLNDVEKAINILEQGAEAYPKEPQILTQLASLLEQKEHYSKAANYLVDLFNIDNKRYGMQYAKAGFLYEKSSLKDSAINVFNNFLSKGYGNDKVTKHLVALEFSKSNFKRTVELLSQPDLNLRKTENKQYLGEALFYLGNYGEALPYLKEIASIKKGCSHCQANLGATYDALQNSDDAIKYYKIAIPLSKDAEAAEYSYRIANIHLRDDNISNAINKYKENIINYSEDMRNYDALVNIYSEQREWGKSADIIKQVLTLPNPAPFYMKKLAFYYNKQNNRIEEEKILKDYIKTNPKDEEALISLAYVNYDRELFQKSANFFQQAEIEKPLNGHNSYSAGNSFYQTDNFDEAIKFLNFAINRGDSAFRNLDLLTKCYRSQKDTSSLTSTLRKMIIKGYKNKENLYELGVLLTEKDSITEGIMLLEEACKLDNSNALLHLRLARLYKKSKTKDKLLNHLNSAIEHSKNNAEVLTFAGVYFRENSDIEKGISYIKQALEINKNFGEALFEMGLYLFNSGNYNDAVSFTERTINKAAYIKGAYTLHSRVLDKLKQHEKAISNIQKALRNDSTDINTLIAAGHIFFGAQNNDMAKNYILKAITLSPENIECFELMGDIYVHESAGSKAAEFYRKALQISGYNKQILLKLGDVLLTINENMQAQRIFSSILKKDSNSGEARFKLVFACLRSNDIDNAIKVAHKFQIKEQKEMWQELSNGLIALESGEDQKAYAALSIAFKLGPEKSITNSSLAKILLYQKEFDLAITHLEKALNVNPFDPFALLLLGQAYELKEDLSTAFNIYKKVSDKYSMIPETYNYLGGLRSKESKHDSAVAVIEKGLKIDPENGELYLALGRELKLTGQKTDALMAYKKSIKYLSRADKSIYLELALLSYKDLNNEKDAIKYAKKFLKNGGTREELNNASLSNLKF